MTTTTFVAPPTVKLYITGRYSPVHRMQDGVTCAHAAAANKRKYVRPVQALLYKLVPCGRPGCFPRVDEFDRIIGRRAA